MYRVEFERSNGEQVLLGNAINEEEYGKMIFNHYNSFGFKSGYWRTYEPEKGHKVIDVGSHTEFYHVYEEE